ncbi:hypothetical protein E5A73_12835 [Sphingomonas gei]|uniref:Uncharacterized protein n=1 Tax=Sphingomonas gei TaxID=1395960 RepID=A0A4S1XFG7_9SPHN|nr:hypothetical protein [Sphingomonas gei]TGX53696.1 hypothetical protein E5A73_12835 [Sphingomonas gei]
MVTLSPGKTFSTSQPSVVVENALDPGRHVFELVVIDDSGNASAPVSLVVSVEKPATKPNPTETPPTRAPDPESLRSFDALSPTVLRNLNLRNLRPK